MKTNLLKLAAPAALVAGLVFQITTALASPGALDTTFGGDGRVVTDLDVADEIAAVAVQADGKIVAAGTVGDNSSSQFVLTRYKSDGSLDSTFGGDGKVTTPIGSSFDVIYGMAIQPDGKIVVAGQSHNGSNFDFAVARYETDGDLDPTFSTDGMASTPVGAGDDRCNCMALQGGKIVLGGTSFNGTYYDFAVVRYNSNGTLDSTFDSDGIVTTPLGSFDAKAYAIISQGGTKLLVAGEYNNGNDLDFVMVRYNDNGSLDSTFGSAGKVATDFTGGDDFASSVLIQGDGKILLGGRERPAIGSPHFGLARYDSNGGLDSTFGTGGRVITPVGNFGARVQSMAIQADGKIVAGGSGITGTSFPSSFPVLALVRYRTNGLPDSTFGKGGTVFTTFPTDAVGGGSSAAGIAIQADGKIVAGGGCGRNSNMDFGLARYHVARPDTRLGLDSSVTTGNNIYNLSGAGQGLAAPIKKNGGTRTVYIGVQNGSPTKGRIKVKGTVGNAKFAVKYFNGSTNVTASVVAGSFATPTLAPGGILKLKAVITAKTMLANQTRNFSIVTTSLTDATSQDKALIKAKSK